VRITVPGASSAQLRELVEWADRHCPVSEGFRRAIPLALEISTDGGGQSPH
jgi:organic hydroperoxide reductase OsmC/OhrA